ncbi:MAG: multicopper oxidase domain-containing protein [Proteobacteria bacterium]|nr:multicopper oxidase domain-containing protein [Pseudomonadota bacterium]
MFALTLQSGQMEFLSGRKTPTIGVNGAFLGPTLRCRAGDIVDMQVKNGLAVSSALHWHGLHVPAKADGGPHQAIAPGATWTPSFAIKQKAGLFWYHSHAMHRTGEQVNAGLAGLILVEDEESAKLGLPSEYGVDDIPLVLQDRRFRADGRFEYMSAMPDMMMGFKGETILINGTVSPELIVRRQRTRLRLLNGSNSRIYNVARSDGRNVSQIGTDGSLLERPVERGSVRLAPGERAEILIDMEPDSAIQLISLPDRVSGGVGMMAMMGGTGNADEFSLLTLRAGSLGASELRLPSRLIEVPSWEARKADRIRSFTLEMGMGGGMMGRGGMRGGMGGMMAMTINGKSMEMDRIDERVPLGATEIWTIRNATPLAHPFHIHDIQFRVLDRNGAPAPAHEQGLKDTVLVDPGETVRVITQFTDFADAEHPYMYHCHILEHEDAGMMGQFVVI